MTSAFGGAGEPDDEATALPRSRSEYSFAEDDATELPRYRRGARSRRDDDDDETQPAREETGLLGWLIVKSGARRGSLHRIGHDVTLGRKNADVVLQDPQVSKLQAKFAIQENQFVVADLLSENGTFVNGTRITQVTPLRENDEIRVGNTVLVLKTLEP